MAIDLSKGGDGKSVPAPAINMTPLVDVVLVLLIIFMVVAPLLTKQLVVHLPKPPDAAKSDLEEAVKPLMLGVEASGALVINGQATDAEDLKTRLPRLLAARADKIVYVSASDKTPYATVIHAMDLIRQSGAGHVALLTQKL